jgi:ABC-type spermidine/putrescine transport system permease subunit II
LARQFGSLGVAAHRRGLVYVFSLGPILITPRSRSIRPTDRFSAARLFLRWWERAFAPEWIDPLLFSLKLGTLAALFSTLLALPLAFALFRYRFRGRARCWR